VNFKEQARQKLRFSESCARPKSYPCKGRKTQHHQNPEFLVIHRVRFKKKEPAKKLKNAH